MKSAPLTPEVFRAKFPNASRDARALNLAQNAALAKTVAGIANPENLAKVIARGEAKRSLSAPKLNKTEQRWRDAHKDAVPFPLKLRWGKSMIYSPDFLCAKGEQRPILIEVKGGFIRDRDIVRFKGCAAEWGWLFDFQMWQWKNRTWTRLL